MKKNERGILTVEASLVLTLFTFFVLFLFSFARVYQAQNMVSHAVIQSADAIALESYLRETAFEGSATDVLDLASKITGSTSLSADSFTSLRRADLPKIAKEKFVSALALSQSDADKRLVAVGVKNGIAGIDFSESKIDLRNDDVIVAVSYTIEMQFPVFGFKEIQVTKAAKAKTFGEILFEVSTGVNNLGWGSTNGDTKVTHGTDVTITANPNYGYVFDKWSDGSTDNPRTVTVTDAQHYVAIFKKDKFGINLSVNNKNYGSAAGGGQFEYLDIATITAIPNTHYYFDGWDDNGDGIIDNREQTRSIPVDKTYFIKAYFKPVSYEISVNVNNSSFGSATVQQGKNSGTSIKAEYGSTVTLNTSSKNATLYKFTGWSHGANLTSTTVKVTGNATYTANYKYNTYTVTFYDKGQVYATALVICDSSIQGSKNYISTSMPGTPIGNGRHFDNWNYGGTVFTEYEPVYGNISVTATWHYDVTLNANGGSISDSGSRIYSVPVDSYFNFNQHTPSRNGFRFIGWDNGCSGNKMITSDITAKAIWECKHKYDDGTSMFERESSVGKGQCKGCEVKLKCKGCGKIDIQKYSGAHLYEANCGVDHPVSWSAACGSNGNYHPSHKWGSFRCITCKYCGLCKNATPKSYVTDYDYVSSTQLCGAHNGHKMKKYKEVVNFRAHAYRD